MFLHPQQLKNKGIGLLHTPDWIMNTEEKSVISQMIVKGNFLKGTLPEGQFSVHLDFIVNFVKAINNTLLEYHKKYTKNLKYEAFSCIRLLCLHL